MRRRCHLCSVRLTLPQRLNWVRKQSPWQMTGMYRLLKVRPYPAKTCYSYQCHATQSFAHARVLVLPSTLSKRYMITSKHYIALARQWPHNTPYCLVVCTRWACAISFGHASLPRPTCSAQILTRRASQPQMMASEAETNVIGPRWTQW